MCSKHWMSYSSLLVTADREATSVTRRSSIVVVRLLSRAKFDGVLMVFFCFEMSSWWISSWGHLFHPQMVTWKSAIRAVSPNVLLSLSLSSLSSCRHFTLLCSSFFISKALPFPLKRPICWDKIIGDAPFVERRYRNNQDVAGCKNQNYPRRGYYTCTVGCSIFYDRILADSFTRMSSSDWLMRIL